MEAENATQPQAPASATPTMQSSTDSKKLLVHDIRIREEAVREFQELVGRKYAASTLGNYQCSVPNQSKAIWALENYADNMLHELEAGTNIILHGPSGTGKDHMLIGLAKKILLQAGESKRIRGLFHKIISTGIKTVQNFEIYRNDPVVPERIFFSVHVHWKNGMDLYGDMRDLIDNRNRSEDKFIKEMTLPDILILSDSLPPRGCITEFQSQVLFRILDTRYRNCRPTWVTLNVRGAAEADERLGAQLVDRLRDGALSIHCDWPSYRKVSQSIG
jgi:DNA replication protein DnaC